ncbi:pilus assembly protein PilP [Oceanimonas sp. CHS3-5]|uniref:pilus assembly protein PilP n=1 Tax=Oceanimonas sp. CHS3-5 TaxID=3068186 RepID=UPI00274019AD|nr:pilus assembly protein PilP [Oceanimonas sp. CHS3-5]MDP5292232.1 pilus assembly protein PilP [Oceanimonas sp. CHS3-5]
MRLTLAMLLVLGLSACSEEEDLRRYVAEVRSRPAAAPEPMPEVNEYVPEAYVPVSERSPFVAPRPESAASRGQAPRDCEQPDMQREKQPLESHSLNNLAMRGSLQNAGEMRALVVLRNGETHLVAPGDRLGLNHGEVTAISAERITLKEYVSDGRGCWTQRETTLALAGEPQ